MMKMRMNRSFSGVDMGLSTNRADYPADEPGATYYPCDDCGGWVAPPVTVDGRNYCRVCFCRLQGLPEPEPTPPRQLALF